MPRYGKQRTNTTVLSSAVVKALMSRVVERGLSNRELASATGLSESTLTRVFRYGRVLDLVEFEALCGALGSRASSVLKEAELSLMNSGAPLSPPADPAPVTYLHSGNSLDVDPHDMNYLSSLAAFEDPDDEPTDTDFFD